MVEQKFRTCNLCEAMCGMVMTVDDGRITDVRGDRDDVLSHGHICPKGPAMRELYEDPDRLRRPLRREGGALVPTTWEAALEEAASRIHEVQVAHGKSAVAVYGGNPTAHNHGAALMGQALHAALGSKNRFDANSQDANPKLYAALLMYGSVVALTIPDVDRTDYFLVLGANPAASNGSVMSLGDVRGRLAGVRERGGRFVLIDPRRTETAAYADEHHFIRPGGDPAFVLALLHVIFAEGLHDATSVHEAARGLEPLQALAARFSPERVAPAIGMTAEVIRSIARGFAGARRAVAYGRVGVCTNEFGPTGSWLIEALNVVTGNFDRAGGAMFTKPAIDLAGLAERTGISHHGRHRTRVRGLPETGGMLPATAMAEEMETPGPGQIRGLITLAGNPVLSVPGGEGLARSLAKLDVMVSIDIYLNETTRHAHVVLPPRSALERGHYDLLFHALAVRNTVKWSEPVVTPDPDTRDDWDILYELSMRLAAKKRGPIAEKAAALALRLGRLGSERVLDVLLRTGPYGDRFLPWSDGLNLERVRRAVHGIDLGPLVPMGRERVRTRSGKVELCPGPLAADVDRVERWVAANAANADSAASAAAPELSLIGRRHVRSNNSWMHNLRSLVKGPDRATLQMHPTDAKAAGLEHGGLVQVSSRGGEVTARLEVTDEVMPSVVSLPHGFGHAAAADTLRIAGAVPGPNANAVTDERLVDPLTATAVLNGVPVRVTRAPAPPTLSADAEE
jgi:anaerobic selenocysteine-containing dehydrogenase